MQLPGILQNKIINFLKSLPNIDDTAGRRAFIYSAGIDSQLKDQIRFDEPPAQFIPLLVTTSLMYGKLHDGQYALAAILEATKSYLGQEKQKYCDTLIEELIISISYQQLQHATQDQAEDLKRGIEKLQTELQIEANRQAFKRRSVGLKPNIEKLFVNRAAYLEQLAEYTIAQNIRMILIIGQGGIGKTALAAKFCDDIERADYQIKLSNKLRNNNVPIPIRSIVYVNQTEMFSLTMQDIFDRLMQTLDDTDINRIDKIIKNPQGSIIQKTNILLQCLQNSITLLVLDNFETVLTETSISDDELRDFIETACATQHNLKIIITSRRNIDIDTFAMKTIPLDKGLDAEHSVEFLRNLAETGIEKIVNASDEELKQLSGKVSGVPMALRSLASFLKKHRRLSIPDLLNDTSRYEDFVRYDITNGLRKLIKEQYENLPNEAKLVLQVLAAYNAPVKSVAVQYILPALDAEAVLDSLTVEYFLIQENNEYFELHPTVQEYAYTQIPDASDEPMAQDDLNKILLHTRAADFYAQLKKPLSELKAIIDLQPYLDEFDHRIKANQYDTAAYLLDMIDFRYLQLWGYYRQVILMREKLVAHLSDSFRVLNNLNFLGCAYMKTMEMMKANHCFEQGVEIEIEMGEEVTRFDFLGNLGRILIELGEFHRAKKMFKEMISTKQRMERLSAKALWIGQLGQALRGLGEFSKAKKCFEIALQESQKAGDTRWQITHLCNVADVLRENDNPATALTLLQQGVTLAEATNNQYGQAFCYFYKGRVFHQIGEYSTAKDNYKKSLLLDIPLVQYKTFINLGITCFHEKFLEEGEKYFIQGQCFCEALLEKTSDLYDVIFHLAMAEVGQGKIEKSIISLEKALTICNTRGVLQHFDQDIRWLQKGFECVGLMERYETCQQMLIKINGRRSGVTC